MIETMPTKKIVAQPDRSVLVAILLATFGLLFFIALALTLPWA